MARLTLRRPIVRDAGIRSALIRSAGICSAGILPAVRRASPPAAPPIFRHWSFLP